MYTLSIQDGGAAYPYLSYWGAIACSTSWVQMLMLICMQIHNDAYQAPVLLSLCRKAEGRASRQVSLAGLSCHQDRRGGSTMYAMMQ